MGEVAILDNSYYLLLKHIKQEIADGLTRAQKAYEREKVIVYWRIGQAISEHLLEHKSRANYGKQLYTRLSHDLNIGERQLYHISKFYNTYPNPQPQPDPMMYRVPKEVETWQYPMQNVMPTPYPMRISNLENGSNNYYRYFGDQTRQDLDYRKDINNSVTNPDFSQMANSVRHGFTATNSQSMKHAKDTKVSLIEGLDPGVLRDVDFMLNK